MLVRCIIDMVARDPWRSKAVSLSSNHTELSTNRLSGLEDALYYKFILGRGFLIFGLNIWFFDRTADSPYLFAPGPEFVNLGDYLWMPCFSLDCNLL
jgi:hypothetical protein